MRISPVDPAIQLISPDDLEATIADASLRRMAFQPLVDLVDGRVVGYEALARVQGPVKAPPDMWFASAQHHGLGGAFGAAFFATALESRPSIPDKCFLSVNVDPHALATPEMMEAIATAGDLSGVVIELTDGAAFTDYRQTMDGLKDLRARGAELAIDDAGSGYSGLDQARLLEPSFVKLDRSLVAGISRDPAKAALVEMLTQFVARIDARVVAEGIERVEELETLIDLHVSLGQGYLLGHPDESPLMIRDLVAIHIRNRAGARRVASDSTIDDLIEQAPTLGSRSSMADAAMAFRANPELQFIPVLDPIDRPIALVVRPESASAEPGWAGVRTVPVGGLVTEVARSALARPLQARFHPVVCVSDVGAYQGVVVLDRLVDRLAELVGEA